MDNDLGSFTAHITLHKTKPYGLAEAESSNKSNTKEALQMEERFSTFKTVRGEATGNGYVETNVGCNGNLHATWTYEVYLEDPSNPDSEHIDSEEISRQVTGPCDHTCTGSEIGWFLCETETKPIRVWVN